MNKWRLLVGTASVVLLIWGASSFIERGRSVGGANDAYEGWIFSCLGLLGLFVLIVPRSGYIVAVVQLAATAYALLLCGMAVVLALAWSGLPMLPQAIPVLILAMASVMALLCGVNAIGAWNIASRAHWWAPLAIGVPVGERPRSPTLRFENLRTW